MTRTRSVRRVLLLAAVGVLLAAGIVAAVVRSDPSVEAGLGPDAPGMLWGSYPSVHLGETNWEAMQRAREAAGRELGAQRRFYLWDDDEEFPTPLDRDLVARGNTLVVTVKPEQRDGVGVPWAAVADAEPGDVVDDRMRSWARRFRDLDVPVYVTFNHEPEADTNEKRGTAQEYVAAWRSWVRVFREVGADQVRFLWIMTDYSFTVPSDDRRAAASWYPGDAWVDGIAADSYNWYGCRPGVATPWMSLREIVEPQLEFWLDHQSEELWLSEFGSVEDPDRPGRKAAWFDQARELFKTPPYTAFDGIVLFEDSPDYPCDWAPDTSASAAQSWEQWGDDPYYAGTTLPVRTGEPEPEPEALPSPRHVAVVTGAPSRLGADAPLVERLDDQGYAVSLHDDASVGAEWLAGVDAVLVTQSTAQGQLGTRLRELDRPVVVWKPSVYGELGLTPGGADGNGSTAVDELVTVVAAQHPLARTSSGAVAIADRPAVIPIGTPAPAADVVASADATPTLFVYHRGDQMVGLTAPACRIAAPVPASGIDALSADGLRLLDRIVDYAVTSCA